ncbi:MAG: SPOR domain-containing protein [Vicingaceae bacterium]|nr:SPOR domain-containing protein [Vicingaceae bacterium]
MKIETYISQLLFYHECVIVPNLGGFVGNYKPAYIQPLQHKFHAPSKQISFNKNLTTNDGLLAHYIAEKETLSYEQACKEIEAFVLTLKNTLKTNKTAQLENIGTFLLDHEHKIHFEPDLSENYLLASYGLSSFQTLPIKRISNEEKITNDLKIVAQTSAKIVHLNENNRKKWIAAAIIAIPLSFLAFWIPTNYDLTGDINYAKLNPFIDDSNKAVYTERKEPTIFNEDDLLLLEDVLKNDTSKSTYLSFSWIKDEQPIVIELQKNNIAEPDTTSVALKQKQLRYHIIAGCFSEKKNAKRMVIQLQKKGFDASIIGQRKGLWTVSYNSHFSRNQALDALVLAKSDNRKAWLLKM